MTALMIIPQNDPTFASVVDQIRFGQIPNDLDLDQITTDAYNAIRQYGASVTTEVALVIELCNRLGDVSKAVSLQYHLDCCE